MLWYLGVASVPGVVEFPTGWDSSAKHQAHQPDSAKFNFSPSDLSTGL